MAPRLSTEEIADEAIQRTASFRSRHARQPDIAHLTAEVLTPFSRSSLRAAYRLLLSTAQQRSDPLRRPLRTLELGCGSGALTCALAQQGHRALGLDSSAESVRIAR